MRWMILAVLMMTCGAMWGLALADGAPDTIPAARAEPAMPDDPACRAYAEAVTKAQEKMRETLRPKLEQRTEAVKKANDALLPAAKAAFAALEEVRKKAEADALASFDARIRDITKTGDLDGALVAKSAKEKFQAWLPRQTDQLHGEFRELTNFDPEKTGLLDRGDESFKIKSIEVVPFDANSVQVRAKMAAAFPMKNNQARGGTAKASSTHPEWEDPIVTLGGNRRNDCWGCGPDAKPWYIASWDKDKPATGKFILIFGRPVGPDTSCVWGNSRIQVNNLPPVTVNNMGPLKVLVIELDKLAAITSVKIELGSGTEHAGMAGLEVHREARGPYH